MAFPQKMFDLTTLADKPSEQELHQLAMKTVGDDLIEQGYEFVAVNSELKKDPQFVCKKEKQLIFIDATTNRTVFTKLYVSQF